jgi:hypothetical protein
MKKKDATLHVESAKIYREQYRSSNPFVLLKGLLSVLISGQSTIEDARFRRHKR